MDCSFFLFSTLSPQPCSRAIYRKSWYVSHRKESKGTRLNTLPLGINFSLLLTNHVPIVLPQVHCVYRNIDLDSSWTSLKHHSTVEKQVNYTEPYPPCLLCSAFLPCFALPIRYLCIGNGTFLSLLSTSCRICKGKSPTTILFPGFSSRGFNTMSSHHLWIHPTCKMTIHYNCILFHLLTKIFFCC